MQLRHALIEYGLLRPTGGLVTGPTWAQAWATGRLNDQQIARDAVSCVAMVRAGVTMELQTASIFDDVYVSLFYQDSPARKVIAAYMDAQRPAMFYDLAHELAWYALGENQGAAIRDLRTRIAQGENVLLVPSPARPTDATRTGFTTGFAIGTSGTSAFTTNGGTGFYTTQPGMAFMRTR